MFRWDFIILQDFRNLKFEFYINLFVFWKDGPTLKLNVPGEEVIIDEYSPTSIGCSAEGHPVPNIRWKFNGMDLINYPSNESSSSRNIWLNFERVKRKHNGTYSCFLNDENRRNFHLIVKCSNF